MTAKPGVLRLGGGRVLHSDQDQWNEKASHQYPRHWEGPSLLSAVPQTTPWSDVSLQWSAQTI
jgi:hypothetical protein